MILISPKLVGNQQGYKRHPCRTHHFLQLTSFPILRTVRLDTSAHSLDLDSQFWSVFMAEGLSAMSIDYFVWRPLVIHRLVSVDLNTITIALAFSVPPPSPAYNDALSSFYFPVGGRCQVVEPRKGK
ncbi:hypothetical protein RRG08_027046 [Elysia crispata]|uniref:Uncharacterized protein n=1 Tax=Elysia crispata TaxID=231223 RepID=A0AAE0ZIF2_9GAST|nr:hypothetical protein RRG08_027046 [Elysia crispata]